MLHRLSRDLLVLSSLLFLVLTTACDGGGGPDTGGAVDATSSADLGPDGTEDTMAHGVIDPSLPGPWGVGVRHFDWVDESRGRTLPVEIWYPVPADATDGADNAFELSAAGAVLGVMETPARRDAAPAEAGPRPLVLFSHGNGGIRFQSWFFCEHLASHGFVVAAPDHVGNTLPDLDNGAEARAQAVIDRPLDIIFVLDRVLADDTWSIDEARIAMTGHSFGGWTSVVTAIREPRFAAVVPLAPGFIAGTSLEEAAADFDRPFLLIGGAPDQIVPFEEHSRPFFEATSASPAYLACLAPAGHYDFTDVCALEALRSLFSADSCSEEVMESDVVHTWVNTLATAFLRSHLLGETGLEDWLDPARYEDDPVVAFTARP